MRHQRGFTLVELVRLLGFLVGFALIVGIMAHFIIKFW